MSGGPDATEWIGGDGPETPAPPPTDLTYMDVDEDPLATTFAPGEMLAEKYELKQLLGRGGFGSVYRAHHQDLGHDVAIKVLNPGIAQNAQAQQRFLKEVQAQTAFVHKYAVQVRDFGRDKERNCLYFTMDLVEGPTLREVLDREGPLAPRRAARVGVQVLEALEEAHKAGLVHRDLKPGNLILTAGPEGEEVRILDFGIAKAVDSAGDSSGGMTRTGSTLGTLRYMSPEQADGARLDGRSDLYSLGVVLFEALSGQLPIESSPEAENVSQSFLTNLLTRPARALQEVAPRLDPALSVAVMTALAKRPDDRFADATGFREALEVLIERLPDEAAAPPQTKGPTDFRVGPDPHALPKLVLLALVVLLAGVVFWKAFDTDGGDAPSPPGSGERTAGQPMTYQDFSSALERLLTRRNADATLVLTETFTGRKVTFTGNAERPLRLELTGLSPLELDALRTLFAPEAPSSKTGAPPAEPAFRIAGDRFTMTFDRDPLRAAKAVVGIFRRVYQAPPGARFAILER